MSQLIRTITLGLHLNADAPERSAARIDHFLYRCKALLGEHGLATRCLRVTCQPLDRLYHAADAPRRALVLAQAVEGMLAGQAWFCLPGPHYRSAAMPVEALEAIPAVLAATQHTFTHTLVSSPAGVHRG